MSSKQPFWAAAPIYLLLAPPVLAQGAPTPSAAPAQTAAQVTPSAAKPSPAKPKPVLPPAAKADSASAAPASKTEPPGGTPAIDVPEEAEGPTTPGEASPDNPKPAPTRNFRPKQQSSKKGQTGQEPPRKLPPAVPMSRSVYFTLLWDGIRNTDPGWDYFSEDDFLDRYGLALGADLLTVGEHLSLGAQVELLGVSAGGQSPTSYVSDSSISTTDLGVAVMARYTAVPLAVPHVRLGGGLSLVDASINAGQEEAETKKKEPFYLLGAGLTLHTPAQRLSRTRRKFNSFTIGLLLEGGYLFSQGIDFSLAGQERAQNEGGRNVSVSSTSLGTLDRAGPFIRLGLTLNI